MASASATGSGSGNGRRLGGLLLALLGRPAAFFRSRLRLRMGLGLLCLCLLPLPGFRSVVAWRRRRSFGPRRRHRSGCARLRGRLLLLRCCTLARRAAFRRSAWRLPASVTTGSPSAIACARLFFLLLLPSRPSAPLCPHALLTRSSWLPRANCGHCTNLRSTSHAWLPAVPTGDTVCGS